MAHTRLLPFAFPALDEVRFWSPCSESRRSFVEATNLISCPLVECATREEALMDAEVAFLLGPPDCLQVADNWAAKDALLVALSNAVGDAVRASAKVFVPFVTEGRVVSGQTVAAVLAGRVRSPEGLAILDLRGLYPWDAAVAHWAYAQCRRLGIGKEFSLA